MITTTLDRRTPNHCALSADRKPLHGRGTGESETQGAGHGAARGVLRTRHRPGGARGGQTDTQTAGHTDGHTDGQSVEPPQGPHSVTNPPPPAQPISEQPARRRPIKAPLSDCPGGTANGRASLARGRGAARPPPAGPAGSGEVEKGQSLGRAL